MTQPTPVSHVIPLATGTARVEGGVLSLEIEGVFGAVQRVIARPTGGITPLGIVAGMGLLLVTIRIGQMIEMPAAAGLVGGLLASLAAPLLRAREIKLSEITSLNPIPGDAKQLPIMELKIGEGKGSAARKLTLQPAAEGGNEQLKVLEAALDERLNP